MNCRHCGATVEHVVADLGAAPPSNAYLAADALGSPEAHTPLRVLVCETCWLVQTEDHALPSQLFSPAYAYFSGVSASWVRHCEANVANLVQRFSIDRASLVVEVASNDGALLQAVQARGIPCYGIEPTASTAAAARSRGLEVVEEFFGTPLADELATAGRQADLIFANNVLAHVPDINDFVRAFARLLRPAGVAAFEFPHLLRLIEETQFDTIYHEHFSYLSLAAADRIFSAGGLSVFDVEEIPTHGGSLRVLAQVAASGARPRLPRVDALLARERAAGLTSLEPYRGFQARADAIAQGFLFGLLEARRSGLRVAAYGAAAKGNTLLNYAGVRPHLIPYVVDRNPHKQGLFLPGSRIPIVSEDRLRADRPDRVVILPWNIAGEVASEFAFVRDWGGRFLLAPGLREHAPGAPS